MKKAGWMLMVPFLLILVSCNPAQGSDAIYDPFSEVDEVVRIQGDRMFYYTLGEVEEAADVIVEAVAKGVIGQVVDTSYDPTFGKSIPGFGYTKREVKVAKVHQGDAKPGDTLTLLEGHYIWPTDEGKKQLVSRSALPPAKTNGKYLFFLQYSEAHEGYWPVGDYQGRFSFPEREIGEKAKAGTLKQADLEVDSHETLPYLMAVYHDVYDTYFDRTDGMKPSEEDKLRLRNGGVKAVYDPDMSLERLMALVPVNLVAEEAVRLLGDQYNHGKAGSSWDEVIRYDFTGDESYRFLYTSLRQDITDIDFAGLESGQMRFQAYYYLDDSRKVVHYSVAYLGDDGHVHVFHRLEDGMTADEIRQAHF